MSEQSITERITEVESLLSRCDNAVQAADPPLEIVVQYAMVKAILALVAATQGKP